MWFIATPKERRSGWGAGNRAQFEGFAATADPPAGLLAYQDGKPLGWCALGPRSRYPSAMGPRSIILKGRNPDEDNDVWLVPCFFVRVGFRRSGITYALLEAAVELAQRYGAKAIEGFPLSGDERSDEFVGREKVFSACGFTCVARPTPRRAVMRRELNS
jgi:GNAT superfamily N-acetyltransferase